jgi:4'-phosphopantetheinyl transferase
MPKTSSHVKNCAYNYISGELQAGTVEVWRVDLGADQSVQTNPSVLNREETDRANRFHFERDRNRFITARAALRTILGAYLNLPAEAVRFSYNAYGKPSIRQCDANHKLTFNLSHSSDIAVLAVSEATTLGIDIERKRRTVKFRALATRFFSEAESRFLAQVPDIRLEHTFFQIWTCKEAYLKGHGRGLSLSLMSFDVSVAENHDPTLIASRHDPDDPEIWQFREIPCHPDYICTLAQRGPISPVTLRDFKGPDGSSLKARSERH